MGLNMMVHSGPKVGKTWLAETAPAPKLFLESAGETKFTSSKKLEWDPLIDGPPEADGSWDTCRVTVAGEEVYDAAYHWLLQGNHPFRSVVTDNFTLIQKTFLITSFGSRVSQQQWGEHLPEMEQKVWKLRNLVDHPTNPLDLVLFCVGSKPEMGKYTPFLQGQIRDNISYILDVVGYLYTQVSGEEYERCLLIQDHPSFVAGTRVHALVEKYGSTIIKPNLTEIVEVAKQAEEANK